MYKTSRVLLLHFTNRHIVTHRGANHHPSPTTFNPRQEPILRKYSQRRSIQQRNKKGRKSIQQRNSHGRQQRNKNGRKSIQQRNSHGRQQRNRGSRLSNYIPKSILQRDSNTRLSSHIHRSVVRKEIIWTEMLQTHPSPWSQLKGRHNVEASARSHSMRSTGDGIQTFADW